MPKKNYLCIQRSASQEGCEPPSPSDMEKMYAVFNEWREKFSDNLVDLGGGLSGTGRVVSLEKTIDGPFVESKEVVGGYMVISAESYEEAIEVASMSRSLRTWLLRRDP
ncbi:YciI family protein [Pelagicoccus sp. SDUM812002]|uniref:YciI family protein n=1 Tax=Pelagicoccus sp. SDUM812002 TaxID=3041266 RepID=UPI00280F563F|nr:YciI family protein [Pelagicoccus sp. SDUM812002]MDQ8186880.1 YciI family protein [Pelagicoccus sp. SDUM812002]